ncbi:hypothetical protein PybrP1_003856 [[Pythium] brassicae (nom. inval.)]|nr:hypothetical protein PybrP1_003856 [[Pythium] brassicae (nom. inval.)]
MEMPPRDALVPLLKLAGTAVVAAAAYRYGSKHVVAAAHRKHHNREQRRDFVDASERKHSTSSAQGKDAAVAPLATSPSSSPTTELSAPEIPRSALVMAMLLRDGYLLLAALGAFVMVLAVLLSVAIVALDENVASVEELRMFAPLVCIGMGLVSAGLLGSLLRSPAKQRSATPTVQRCPFSGAVASMPLPPRKKLVDGESETEEDEDGAPRVSRCPFGFT